MRIKIYPFLIVALVGFSSLLHATAPPIAFQKVTLRSLRTGTKVVYLVNDYDFDSDRYRRGELVISYPDGQERTVPIKSCLNPSLSWIFTGDVDSDGRPDVVVLGNRLCIISISPTPTLVAMFDIRTGSSFSDIAITNDLRIIDINGDGVNEILFRNRYNRTRIEIFQMRNRSFLHIRSFANFPCKSLANGYFSSAGDQLIATCADISK